MHIVPTMPYFLYVIMQQKTREMIGTSQASSLYGEFLGLFKHTVGIYVLSHFLQ